MDLLQIEAGITKYDDYYKLRQYSHSRDYNGVRAVRGRRHITSKDLPKCPSPTHTRATDIKLFLMFTTFTFFGLTDRLQD